MLRRATWVAWVAGLVGLAFTSLDCSHTRVSALAPPKAVPLTSTQVSALAPPKAVPPTRTAPADKQTITGIVRAAAPDAPEAATVEVGDVVYKVIKDDNGKTVAKEAKDRRAEIKGTVDEKDGVRWITVLSAKLGAQ